ncbi:polyketide synthase [Tellurirhabdus bombi]|uniref:polyketide synthase n=1 Tax=Tellurirhabdus bombi TaxID=2907205 RepID=UPI001F1B7C2F|nr:polyketide synthase [Tellurirhabdus bombi]
MAFSSEHELDKDGYNPLFIHQLVEQVIPEHYHRTALVFGEKSVTYKELNDKANGLSQAILHHRPDAELIGVSTSRSLEMVISVLAILKAGKAYLPLDPKYPAARLQELISDSRVDLCLTRSEEVSLFEKVDLAVLASDDNFNYTGYTGKTVDKQFDTGYVLYTSGSTGKPKGVSMGHRPLVNLLRWQRKHSRAGVGTRTLHFAPLSFDASFLEFFDTFLSGGTLVLIKEELRLDLANLLHFIDKNSVNRLYVPFVALQYLAEAAVSAQRFPACLEEIMTAGEQLKITPQLIAFFSALPDCILYNQYGPTECHVVTQLTLEGDPNDWPLLPTIGIPIDNTTIYITDENLNPLPAGEIGELCVAGDSLADGYLHKPELTAEKFVHWTSPEGEPTRIYRTGDLARYLPDGNIEFLGRKDDQVKIRGYRIELGEIEVILNAFNGVKQAVVVARERGGEKQLVAYLVSDNQHKDSLAVRKELEQKVPDYMIPSAFVWMDDFPKTSSGKVDKKALPAPEAKRADLGTIYRKPVTEPEKNLAEIWIDLLGIDKVGLDDNFFELGGNSLLAQKTVAALKSRFNYILPITKLYQYPTVTGIAQYLTQKSALPSHHTQRNRQKAKGDDVAVISMAGRFPGANSIEELWELLKEGRETTRFFADDELDPSVPDAVKNDPTYVKARGIIADADQFDYAFFGLNPKLAELMDPQQRIFLEIAWEALEQTGYVPQTYSGSIGVYAGCGNNTYYLNNVLQNPQLVDQIGGFQVSTLNEKDYIASRTAYQLNLRGPAVSVYSACSTSLLAIAQAVESIRNGQCDLALAGGASITAPINSGYLYQDGAMLSGDGHCRSFDAEAQGTVFSDGAGVVLLKSLEAAKRDGDVIYAVIKGVGVNNDGGGKGSFTAPNAEGQAGAIVHALTDAQIDPATIQYVEAHGTATPLGDPIEMEGLTMAFGEQARKQFCAIGSIKSNMGHLTQAAGVAGLIKTALVLHHRQIPASLGFKKPNPAIDFANSPFYVNTQLSDWLSESVRRAGVSSFGVGGTNVHVVLEEYENAEPASWPGRPLQLFTWSARTEASREAYAHALAEYVRKNNPRNLADIAYTLQTNRADFNERRFVIAADETELIANLLTDTTALSTAKKLTESPGEVVFLFPGQGSQYLNMGRDLYENEAVYRQAVDECARLLLNQQSPDIRFVLYPEVSGLAAEEQLKNTRYTQPALFVTEYALTKLWMSWGVEPTVFCGHSIGEFVAAHLAGVFTLPDALKLIATRARMVSDLPEGSMLSVRLEARRLLAILPETLSIAAINSPNLCVVAGPDEAISAFVKTLAASGVPNRVLLTSHAFHSAMMDSIVADFEAVVRQVPLKRPQKPIVSTVSGDWLTDAQATDPSYWAKHLRMTVRFSDALETIFGQDNPLLLEVGPGTVTSTLARQQTGSRPATILASLENTKGHQTEYQSILKALGHLWLAGVRPDWQKFYENQQRIKLKLPTYSFDKKRCWVEPAPKTVQIESVPLSVKPEASVQLAVESPFENSVMRKGNLINKIKEILENASGIEMDRVTPDMSFLEIGLDSLLITQLALTFKKEFGLPITFRQLNEEYATLDLLADYLDQHLPAEAYQPAPVPAPQAPPVQLVVSHSGAADLMPQGDLAVQPGGNLALSLIAQQLELLSKQITLIQGQGIAQSTPGAMLSVPAAPTIQHAPAPAMSMGPTSANGKPNLPKVADLTPEEAIEIKKPFGATARIERQSTDLSPKQHQFIQELTQRYNQKTSASKNYAQEHREHMADPRVVSGFRPLTKELVYPLVVNKSKGSRLWDMDGNEYIDVLSGFGSNLFGYQPDFIKDALHDQVEKGFEVGPQHDLAGDVSKLICEFTNFDRAALCNTGSEAVLGTMRIARTVTGRSLIVAFSGSYHGIVDEVIVRGTKKLKSFPAAPGIMPEAVQNMLILDYGTEESLTIIRERAHELAAVLVEPVQSRRPEFRPVDFLKKVREITEASGTALIFDEVITGFRMHPGGAQALFGIDADLASYGKVIGGGLSIGAIAGKKSFMDALDGGFWQYGDASFPEVGVTYFAGTFVRHPLALAASKASLEHMKAQGPELQKSLTRKAERLADALNADFERRQLPFFIAQFGSLWKLKMNKEIPYSELLFTLLREKGIHIWDGFPCFMTEAHTVDEIDFVISSFIKSVDEMIEVGFFEAKPVREAPAKAQLIPNKPPVEGARLGRDAAGNPAWFIVNPDQPGKYLKVEIK